jgi:hypothetical protein
MLASRIGAVGSRLAAGALLASVLALSGCLAISGSTEKRNSPTVGQELQDLQVAHEKGAINDAEYNAAKARLLKRIDP